MLELRALLVQIKVKRLDLIDVLTGTMLLYL